jgi:sugar fermentation stimulation protein A
MDMISVNKVNSGTVMWPRLIQGKLVKRYKRFLADVKLADGKIVTAHCPNSGSMRKCSEPGRTVYLSLHDDPKRKLKYTWELIQMPESLVGVNTMVPNRLVKKSIENGLVEELGGYREIFTEVKVGNSRLDLMLIKSNAERCYIEIKNCSLVENSTAFFPDAVTARGKKHLEELRHLSGNGDRCIMFYLVQRMDASQFKPADHIDPQYGTALRKAVQNHVEILVYDVTIDLKSISIGKKIPFLL